MLFLCTFIYAKCNHIDRRSIWADLVTISSFVSGPWLIGGDFNVVFSASECLGTVPSLLHSNEFADMISDCGLLDISFIGAGPV